MSIMAKFKCAVTEEVMIVEVDKVAVCNDGAKYLRINGITTDTKEDDVDQVFEDYWQAVQLMTTEDSRHLYIDFTKIKGNK